MSFIGRPMKLRGLPEITVPKHRRLTAPQRRGLSLHWVDLARYEVRDGVTSPDRTVVDCLRLPFREALAIADSALRHGFGQTRLAALAAGMRGPGAVKARRVARLASARAANPFESGLRAIAADVPGLQVEPHVSVFDPQFLGRLDLVDPLLVLRFSWEDVMLYADEVRAVLEAAVEVRTESLRPGCRPA